MKRRSDGPENEDSNKKAKTQALVWDVGTPNVSTQPILKVNQVPPPHSYFMPTQWGFTPQTLATASVDNTALINANEAIQDSENELIVPPSQTENVPVTVPETPEGTSDLPEELLPFDNWDIEIWVRANNNSDFRKQSAKYLFIAQATEENESFRANPLLFKIIVDTFKKNKDRICIKVSTNEIVPESDIPEKNYQKQYKWTSKSIHLRKQEKNKQKAKPQGVKTNNNKGKNRASQSALPAELLKESALSTKILVRLNTNSDFRLLSSKYLYIALASAHDPSLPSDSNIETIAVSTFKMQEHRVCVKRDTTQVVPPEEIPMENTGEYEWIPERTFRERQHPEPKQKPKFGRTKFESPKPPASSLPTALRAKKHNTTKVWVVPTQGNFNECRSFYTLINPENPTAEPVVKPDGTDNILIQKYKVYEDRICVEKNTVNYVEGPNIPTTNQENRYEWIVRRTFNTRMKKFLALQEEDTAMAEASSSTISDTMEVAGDADQRTDLSEQSQHQNEILEKLLKEKNAGKQEVWVRKNKNTDFRRLSARYLFVDTVKNNKHLGDQDETLEKMPFKKFKKNQNRVCIIKKTGQIVDVNNIPQKNNGQLKWATARTLKHFSKRRSSIISKAADTVSDYTRVNCTDLTQQTEALECFAMTGLQLSIPAWLKEWQETKGNMQNTYTPQALNLPLLYHDEATNSLSDVSKQTHITGLLLAAYLGDVACVRYLLENKADVLPQNQLNGQTALFYAVQSQCDANTKERIIDLLLSHKANVAVLDIQQQSVLHYCIKNKDYNSLRKILAALDDHAVEMLFAEEDAANPNAVTYALLQKDFTALVALLEAYKEKNTQRLFCGAGRLSLYYGGFESH